MSLEKCPGISLRLPPSQKAISTHPEDQNLVSLVLRNEIDRQIEILAHDQSQVSHWDETVNAVQSKGGHSYFRDKVAGWLWKDFGIQYSVVVSPDHKPFAVLFEHGVLDAKHGAEVIANNRDLIDIAHQNYMEGRIAHEDGFKLGAHPVRSEQSIHVTAVREVNGQLGFVAVQAIVPHEKGVLDHGLPHALLTFKPLSDETMAAIGQKLGLARLSFVEGAASGPFDESLALHDDAGNSQIFAYWNVTSPAQRIWNETSTTIIVSLIAIAICLGLMVMRHLATLKKLHQSERRNRFMALHDPLTGLANRMHFDNALSGLLDEGHEEPLAVLCIDLDKFKAVNDTFGHHAGDQVIQTAAFRINKAVGDKGLVARIGGDEFVAIISEEASRDMVDWIADTIIEDVCAPIPIEEGQAHIGASIGIAFSPDHGADQTTLMRHADTALYKAKEAGRGNAQIFEPEEEEAEGVTSVSA